MKLFFQLKINQKLLLGSLLIATLFLASCASHKKSSSHARSDNKVKSTSKRVLPRDNKRSDEPRRHEDVAEITEEHGNAPENKVHKVIAAARSFIGTPYKYGGTTRSGMDCSGLLMNSFKAIELSLPRTSADQSTIGEKVNLSDLEPGDLVFFATGSKKNQITHVGLVTERKGKDNIKFIHASSSLGVVETNIFSDYYKTRFRTARRVIK